MVRFAILLASSSSLLLAGPAAAIQEVVLGRRAPSFAAAASAGLGWETLPMPLSAPVQAFETPGIGTSARDPRRWAFTSGETVRTGSFLFNTSSGPSWSMASPLGFSSSMSRFGGLGGGFGGGLGDLGFTTRSTSAVMAAENLMFYTSVGRTTYGGGASAVPSIGLGVSMTPATQMDVRTGFKMELMPGLTFGAEAAFSQPTR
jgi:hypothetical protein